MSVPSGDGMLSGHYDLDLALKSPNIIVKDGLSPLTEYLASQNMIKICHI